MTLCRSQKISLIEAKQSNYHLEAGISGGHMGWLKGIGLVLLGSAVRRTIFPKQHARRKFEARVERDQDKFWTRAKNKVSPINSYGTCFKCEGSGSITLDCKICKGSGTFKGACKKCSGSGEFTIPARTCLTCDGSGDFHGRVCRKCNGSGVFRAERTVTCNQCDGRGSFSSECNKCGGAGTFRVSCKKCGGSGWYRFPK